MPKLFEEGEFKKPSDQHRSHLLKLDEPNLASISAWAREHRNIRRQSLAEPLEPQDGSLTDMRHIEVTGIARTAQTVDLRRLAVNLHRALAPKPRRHLIAVHHQRCLIPLKRSHGGLGGVDWQKSWQGERPMRRLPERGKQYVGTVTV
jgi:hypothetical protein